MNPVEQVLTSLVKIKNLETHMTQILVDFRKRFSAEINNIHSYYTGESLVNIFKYSIDGKTYSIEIKEIRDGCNEKIKI